MTKNQAVRYYGSVKQLALALGIRPAAVSQWDAVPEGRQWQLEVITGGELRVDNAIRRAAAA